MNNPEITLTPEQTVRVTDQIIGASLSVESRIDMVLRSKSELKLLGDPKKIRRNIRASFTYDAIKLAIAEEIMANPPLYGHQFKDAFERRCREVLGS